MPESPPAATIHFIGRNNIHARTQGHFRSAHRDAMTTSRLRNSRATARDTLRRNQELEMHVDKRILVTGLAGVTCAPLLAQTTALLFPSRPIRPVPLGTAGGPIDAPARPTRQAEGALRPADDGGPEEPSRVSFGPVAAPVQFAAASFLEGQRRPDNVRHPNQCGHRWQVPGYALPILACVDADPQAAGGRRFTPRSRPAARRSAPGRNPGRPRSHRCVGPAPAPHPCAGRPRPRSPGATERERGRPA